MQCAMAPGTGISMVHSSGTSSHPIDRAAIAGNALARSGVTVKITEMMCSRSTPLRAMISGQQLARGGVDEIRARPAPP